MSEIDSSEFSELDETDVSADIDGIPLDVEYMQSANDVAGSRVEGPTVNWGDDQQKLSLFERIDELTWSDCATCRVWRAAILIGFTAALIIDIGLRLWT